MHRHLRLRLFSFVFELGVLFCRGESRATHDAPNVIVQELSNQLHYWLIGLGQRLAFVRVRVQPLQLRLCASQAPLQAQTFGGGCY